MQIQNQDATQIIRDQAKLTLSEGFPQNLLPNVQPVMDMTPDFHHDVNTFSSANSGSGSITAYSGAAGKQLAITGVQISYVKDATCDVATGSMSVVATKGGISRTIAAIAFLTLTAQHGSVSVAFERPFICDPATNITQSNTFTVGSMRRVVTVQGYEITN